MDLSNGHGLAVVPDTLSIGPMCICGWQLVAVAMAIQSLIVAYGEIEGRRHRKADRLAERRRLAAAMLAEHHIAARPRTGKPADALATRDEADTQPYNPGSPHKTT